MPNPPVPRSERFTKAARAERKRLERRRERLAAKRESQQRKVDELDQELEAVGEEIRRLDELTGPLSFPIHIHKSSDAENREQNLLKGAKIRTLAVPLLLRQCSTGAIHYRDWLVLLNQEGYDVAGQRPDAVFLNQVVRSPLVRATTKAGYYEIDLEAADRLRTKLQEQQTELAEFMRQTPTEGGEAFAKHREQEREMNTAIARTERELKEAERAIEIADGAPADLRAA